MEERRTPEEYLLQWEEEEAERRSEGRLKIFFGYAAGVGKTYAMLESAHLAKKKGIDVVAGYIEPHARPETAALIQGLETIPPMEIDYNGVLLKEFDLDAALKRKPQLILVDELAHTNARGCRHGKRYGDIGELLKNGIDVYTTVNVQHIESLNDMVSSITGIHVRERIPDSVFDEADQVELIDIEPGDLMERLTQGKVYKTDQAERAKVNFFTEDNLTALREIALRRCADRVNLLSASRRRGQKGRVRTDEHILVCLSSAPSNATIIRTAARMASAFRAGFTALFVETPSAAAMSEENKKRLTHHIHIARRLGAKVETVQGEDVPLQIAEFARLTGVSKIVIGRSAASRRLFHWKKSLTDRLIEAAPNIDIHIIPDALSKGGRPSFRERTLAIENRFHPSWKDTGKSLLILVVSSLVALLFDYFGFSEANVITVYLLGVLLTAVTTEHWIYSLISALVSVLLFNFLFTLPRYTFVAYDKGYPVTFLIMFLAGLITSSLASRLKKATRQAVRTAFRTKTLLDSDRLLQEVSDAESIMDVTAEQLCKLLQRDIILYLAKDGEVGEGRLYPFEDGEEGRQAMGENERAVASWVYRNNHHAGATTDTLSNSRCFYLALRGREAVYGVVGIVVGREAPDVYEQDMLLSILGEAGLAMENAYNRKKREENAILAKNEQLRANLLRSISHDLRTPLTSILGNATSLGMNDGEYTKEERVKIASDIREDAEWLIHMVENLLAISRIQGDGVQLNMTAELVSDIVEEALRRLPKDRGQRTIRVDEEEEMLLVKADGRLLVQVLLNLIENALKYTEDGAVIRIDTKRQGKFVRFRVQDNGPGIPDEMKERIFDMFYTGSKRLADSRRSLGLGLSLCKSIVEAHGGQIGVEDAEPRGTIFSFTIPAEEVELNGETLDPDRRG